MLTLEGFLATAVDLHDQSAYAFTRDGFIAELALGWDASGNHVLTVAGGGEHLDPVALRRHVPEGVRVFDGPLCTYAAEMASAFGAREVVAVTHLDADPSPDGLWVRTTAVWPMQGLTRTILTQIPVGAGQWMPTASTGQPAKWLASVVAPGETLYPPMGRA